jgi:NADPH:quinone reductase-like Zn-dependent oxidoreductase
MKHIPLVIGLTGAVCMAGAVASRALAAQGQLPTQQQAVVLTGSSEAPVIKLESIPVLQPGPGQVLIRVYAAAVNGSDGTPRRPSSSADTPVRTVPGQDVAGVVAAVGPDVTDRKPGMAVFGIVNRTGLNGAYAHFAVANVSSTAPKPSGLSFAQAAGLGVAGVTALRVLDEAQVHAGQRVLILGIAGGVGSLAAQIAVARGATVLGTASPRHSAYLRSIGVSRVINYATGDVATRAGQVNAIIDTVGGDEALQALGALMGGGRLVSIARAKITAAACSARQVQCLGSPGPAAQAPAAVIQQVARLAGEGELRAHIDRTYRLAQAADALHYMAQKHTEGKVVLAVTGNATEH